MTGLSKIKEDEATEFRLLRNYLVHNDIPKGLQQKIVRFLQNQCLRQDFTLKLDSQVLLEAAGLVRRLEGGSFFFQETSKQTDIDL